MNSEATLLQNLEAAAQKALGMALLSANPAAIAAARAQLAVVQMRQTTFHFAQSVHLLQARGIARQQPTRVGASPEFHQTLLQTKKLPHPEGLAVQPIPANSRSPRYEPVAGFSKAQTMAFEWKMPMDRLVPEWLAPWWKPQFYVPGRCAATILPEGRGWAAALTRAKL